MKISIATKKNLEEIASDMLVVGVFVSSFPSSLQKVDKAFKSKLSALSEAEGFTGKSGQLFVLHTFSQIKSSMIALVGLGEESKLEIEGYRKAAAIAFRCANDKRAKHVTLALPSSKEIKKHAALRASAEGIHLARYRFDKYINENKNELFVEHIEILADDISGSEGKKLCQEAQVVAESVTYARDLINEGPWVINPPAIASKALEEGKDAGLQVQVLDEKALAKEKMNLMLAVGRGAQDAAPPRLIRFAYRASKKAKRHIALVGKGVTFDSGGLDIKTADGMLDMKIDMSGAAAVFGTMLAIAKLKPQVDVTGYLACVENGISAHSYHPGDVIKSRRGLYIEINNTDAEGRLVLADALDYAQDKDRPDIIIDIATLTGACMVALGPTMGGIFATHDELAEELIRAGKKNGEDFWRLPLNENLRDQLKSSVADMKNSGGRLGGAITGALFLKKFVNDDVKWAHLDIAGPATNDRDHPYLSKGAVGFTVRTLTEFICDSKLS